MNHVAYVLVGKQDKKGQVITQVRVDPLFERAGTDDSYLYAHQRQSFFQMADRVRRCPTIEELPWNSTNHKGRPHRGASIAADISADAVRVHPPVALELSGTAEDEVFPAPDDVDAPEREASIRSGRPIFIDIARGGNPAPLRPLTDLLSDDARPEIEQREKELPIPTVTWRFYSFYHPYACDLLSV